MAIKIFEKYAPRANVGDANYPEGSIKNESIPGANDGTPLDEDWGNDMLGFSDALLAEAGITPSGDPDTAVESDRLNALNSIIDAKIATFDTVSDYENYTEELPIGKNIYISDRGAEFTIINGTGTANSYDIIASIAVSQSAELIIDSNIINPFAYGVRANSDGTTGNGNDDTGAWLQSISSAKSLGFKIVGPSGGSRITSTLDFTEVDAEFNGTFIKDFDGIGLTVTEGGAVFTYLTRPEIHGVGVQSAGSHGVSVTDSRVIIKGLVSGSHGGDGYRHTDDDGNNNHCEIEVRAENNGGHGVYIVKGVEGDDSNNWKVDFSTFGNTGDGVRVDLEGKDWIGRVRAEDNGGIGLNLIDGRRHQWTGYLETNTGGDYNIADICQSIEIVGRLGSGNVNNNLSYRLKLGGNTNAVKGTQPIADITEGSNLTASGSNWIEQRFVGSSNEVMQKILWQANSDFQIQSISRTDSVTVLAMMGLDASDGALQFSDGTTTARLRTGLGNPNGVVTDRPGSVYFDKSTTAAQKLYVKESGNPSNTGWVLK